MRVGLHLLVGKMFCGAHRFFYLLIVDRWRFFARQTLKDDALAALHHAVGRRTVVMLSELFLVPVADLNRESLYATRRVDAYDDRVKWEGRLVGQGSFRRIVRSRLGFRLPMSWKDDSGRTEIARGSVGRMASGRRPDPFEQTSGAVHSISPDSTRSGR